MQDAKGSILIKGGRLLTMDRTPSAMEKADVLVKDGLIKGIGPGLEVPDAEVIEAGDTIIMPGFDNCHRHMWQTQLRAITADWSLFDYSSRIRSVYTSFYDPEDAYIGTYAGYLEAINAGKIARRSIIIDSIYSGKSELFLRDHCVAALRTICKVIPGQYETCDSTQQNDGHQAVQTCLQATHATAHSIGDKADS